MTTINYSLTPHCFHEFEVGLHVEINLRTPMDRDELSSVRHYRPVRCRFCGALGKVDVTDIGEPIRIETTIRVVEEAAK